MFGDNVGAADRFVRLLIGLVMFAVAVSGAAGGATTVFAYSLSMFMFVTAALGSCPVYAPFRVNTCRASKRRSSP